MTANTRMTDEWVQRVMRDNPTVLLDNGNIRTCPVRLSFPDILKQGKPQQGQTEGKYGAVLLFPLGADMTVYKQEATRIVQEKLPAALKPNGPKVYNPLKKQDENDGRYDGYVTGAQCISANSSTSKPVCVDQRLAPIVDESKVYPGIWAVCTVRAGWFDVGPNKGPTFYLQSVMVVADDDNIAGGGVSNPSKDFAGVKIDASVNPAAGFGEGAAASEDEVDLFS